PVFDNEPPHLPRAGLIKDGIARTTTVSKDTGVTINEQTCEERGEASTTGHALSRVVAEQDSPNGDTDDATDESVVRPVKKEASKKESQPIVSKENVSKSTSSSASKDVTVKHKPYE
ncbi:hypothetical protein BGZ89_008237, partial [Linnemannia elongata]